MGEANAGWKEDERRGLGGLALRSVKMGKLGGRGGGGVGGKRAGGVCSGVERCGDRVLAAGGEEKPSVEITPREEGREGALWASAHSARNAA